MDDPIVWLIIVSFYAPLHYLLPILVLFVTGRDDRISRKRRIRQAIIDSTASMIVAFVLVIGLANADHLSLAMLVLFLSMGAPLIRIATRRSSEQVAES